MQQSRKTTRVQRKGPRASSKNEKPEIRKLERALGMTKTRQKMLVSVNLRNSWLPRPQGPMSGAHYSTRQLASTFTNSTGFTLGGTGDLTGQLNLNSSTPLLFSCAFELVDLAQVATFAALFDQYRIEKVRVHFKARSNAISVFNIASPNSGVPSGFIVVDRDDSAAPASMAALQEYDTAVEFEGSESVEVTLVPSITRALFASGAFSGYETADSGSVWIDMANTGVPTYGIKGGISSLTATTTSAWIWDVTAEYIVSFRNTK